MHFNNGEWHCDEGEFSHTGKLGDVIFSLAAIKWWTLKNLTPATLILSGGNSIQANDPDGLSQRDFWRRYFVALRPLLLSQPYIKSAVVCEQEVRSTLRGWNDWWRHGCIPKRHLHTVGCNDVATLSDPWIDVPSPRRIAACVINWTDRYTNVRNIDFPWTRILDYFKGDCIFVGTSREYSTWCKIIQNHKFAPPFHPTDDLLELAEVIKGCTFFVGCPSLPHAIAAGTRTLRLLDASQDSDVYWGAPECILLSTGRTISFERLDWYIAQKATLETMA